MRNLGIMFLLLIACVNVLCSSMSFVDNTDLVVDRANSTDEMQQILDMCNASYSAIGGKIQEQKTSYFS